MLRQVILVIDYDEEAGSPEAIVKHLEELLPIEKISIISEASQK